MQANISTQLPLKQSLNGKTGRVSLGRQSVRAKALYDENRRCGRGPRRKPLSLVRGCNARPKKSAQPPRRPQYLSPQFRVQEGSAVVLTIDYLTLQSTRKMLVRGCEKFLPALA